MEPVSTKTGKPDQLVGASGFSVLFQKYKLCFEMILNINLNNSNIILKVLAAS